MTASAHMQNYISVNYTFVCEEIQKQNDFTACALLFKCVAVAEDDQILVLYPPVSPGPAMYM